MQRYASSFKRASTKLANAATKTVQDYSVGALPDEPTFTGALVTRLRDALDGFATSGIVWSAKVLTSHGGNAEETVFGADFLGVLTLSLPGLTISKGFLAQAKRQEPGSKLSKTEWGRLKEQCDKMLSFTPESFVFVYALNGVYMIPAIKVASCIEVEDLHTLHPQNTGPFYRNHFECFIGDRRLDSATPQILREMKYRKGLAVSGIAETRTKGE